MRPLVALVALVAAMAAILFVYGASPTHAAGSCSTTARGTTCTFASTGAEDTFVVPAGVNTIHVEAIAAPGGVGFEGGSAGRGATVRGDLSVFPGQTLYVNVGGEPTRSGVGGFNGGGSSSGGGGGGGGASDVRTVSRAEAGSLSSRLIVAGGGGGSGLGIRGGACPFEGGAGGDQGSDGSDGAWCRAITPPVAGGTSGKAGGQDAGGLGGFGAHGDGQNGSLGLGGNGGGDFYGGGGGGGGYYGGGGGGSANPSGTYSAPGGGGGGGSNLVPPGGAFIDPSVPNPRVSITYQGGVSEPPPTPGPDEDKQACKKGGYEALGFKNQGQCIKAVHAEN